MSSDAKPNLENVLENLEERMRNVALDEARNGARTELSAIQAQFDDFRQEMSRELTSLKRELGSVHEQLAEARRELAHLKQTGGQAASAASDGLLLTRASDASVGLFWFDFARDLSLFDALSQAERASGQRSRVQHKLIAGIPLAVHTKLRTRERVESLIVFVTASKSLAAVAKVPWPLRRSLRFTVIDRDGAPFKSGKVISTTQANGSVHPCFADPTSTSDARRGLMLSLAELQQNSERLLVDGKLCVSVAVDVWKE